MAKTVILLHFGGICVISKDNGGVNEQIYLLSDRLLSMGLGGNIFLILCPYWTCSFNNNTL